MNLKRNGSGLKKIIRGNPIKLVVFSLLMIGFLGINTRRLFNDPVSNVILDRDGILLGARVSGDGQWRFPAPDSVPEKLKKATIAFEDRYFFLHPGVNPVSTIRALLQNLKAHKVVSGGSTLTMQTIRLSRKGKARTFPEKVIEMVLAIRLEVGRSKNEILALYMGHAPYGGNVVGVEAASWRYFGLASHNLSWAEAATLAVLPNSPALIHPGRNRELLVQKRNRLLQKLYRLHWIDRVTLETSLTESIPDEPSPMPRMAPHLLNRVSKEIPGKIIKSSISAELQSQVNLVLEQHHQKLAGNEIHNLAAIVISVETGQVIAYVGNCDNSVEKAHSNDVDIIRSLRSTGSLLKPLLYAAMLDDGKILPGSLVPDIPVNLGGFAPKNFSGQYEGAVPAGMALSRSLNVPAVQLLRQYGVERFLHLLQFLGMKTLNKPADYYGLSLILGGAEGRLEEMANIYASLSRVLNHYSRDQLYYPADYRPVTYLIQQKVPADKGNAQPELFSASSIWYTYQAMIAVNRPDEEAGWQQFSSSRSIAWKTGTSFGYRDGWAIGTTPEWVVGVWAGNADGEGRPGLTGVTAAAPVMFEIFGLLPPTDWFEPPLDEIVPAAVCAKSGYLAGPYCTEADTVKIPIAGLKSPLCPFHQLVHLSADGQCRVNSNCYEVADMVHQPWFVLPPVQEWYFIQHHADYRKLPPYLDGCESVGRRSMDLIYPGQGLKIYIPRGLGGNKERVVFEAVHTNPDALIFWHLDDQYITTTQYVHQVQLLPEPGVHRLVLVDESGEELVRNFEAVEP
ncbi:MAG: penicillin-binding protein 1C [Bacteroidales bacterium]|nr:penicillin-binding protein 1C [Bacteroidales bacterium]